MEIYLPLIGGGLLGGFLAGLLGIGGGTIYILILESVLTSFVGENNQYLPQLIIANSFFAICLASLLANIELLRKKEVYFNKVIQIGIAGIIAAVLITELVVHARVYESSKMEWNIVLDQQLYDWIIIVILIFLLAKLFLENYRDKSVLDIKLLTLPKAIVVGIVGGGLAAISGLGGGAFMNPIMNGIFKIDYKKARSVSIGVIFLTSLIITVDNLTKGGRVVSPLIPQSMRDSFPDSTGYIIWPVALTIGLSAMIMAPIGVRAARKLSSRKISFIYVAFLTLFIAKKIYGLL